MKRAILISSVIVLALFCACSTPDRKNQTGFTPIEMIKPGEMIEQQKKAAEPGPPPFTEELTPVTKGLDTEQKIFSMTFENAPIGSIINALMKDSDMNLTVESAVDLTKPVTITLKNATLEEVLEMAVVRGAGYAWSIKDNCLNIQRFQEHTYHFDYLDIANESEIEVGGDMLASGRYCSNSSNYSKLKVSMLMLLYVDIFSTPPKFLMECYNLKPQPQA